MRCCATLTTQHFINTAQLQLQVYKHVLREVKKTRQIKGEYKRRWFSSQNSDLVVWYDKNNKLVGFQLCYDKVGDEKSYTWKYGSSSEHAGVDTGECVGMNIKQTPVLVPDGAPDYRYIKEVFLSESFKLPKDIIDMVRYALSNENS